mmetsp:Transcript_10852/g.22987  ORF Transcript_10852/g.22987 Transcript_10852/m.22987 type:complete len:564 (+) Transcript_10852:64-1755(+)|eukprot:CAMPEP_0201235660 /NCGR_PEP_ID=MMETSP0852-20130820/7228_1 /ASSEMBLY_ACC=CAM_ASM_000632 /TAXON_ID=183588 /ORGANISM="Pseudo-nitzschia fraudulenta, Strain WWA7" /LENGTH=563 /DNA_ID=CAMNT_0047529323 /DNA_START=4 /DNA_END=1695 /DNA_ORIENTATION=-
MARFRNVLQQRANRFRNKLEQKKISVEPRDMPVSHTNDEETQFTHEFIKQQREPDGDCAGSVYSIEAKDTRATAVETFSSTEENTAYSDENEHTTFTEHERNVNFMEDDRNELQGGGEFLDLAYEAHRHENNAFSGGDFIDLLQESAQNRGIEVDGSNYSSSDDEEADVAPKKFAQPKTIEFVDSEDGKVFAITQDVTEKDPLSHGDLLQNVRSLDNTNDTENDGCSHTLNTNIESLLTSNGHGINRVLNRNDNDAGGTNFSNRFNNLHVKIGQGGKLEEFDKVSEAIAYEDDEYAEESIPQGDSELYDCDDGQMYVPFATPQDQKANYLADGTQAYGYEEDVNFFEQLRTVQSRNTNGFQTGPEEMINEQVQPENWRSVTNQIHFEDVQNVPLSPKLEDPYVSDSNSSWEEGSFATGASRNVSRVDTAYKNDDDDDAGSYDGTVDGSEYSSDDNTHEDRSNDRPFVRMLKTFRDMNVDDERSLSSDDEDDYEYNKKRSKKKKKRRSESKKPPPTFFERLGDLGVDILNDTIEHAERQDRSPRPRNQSSILDSFTDLFACGEY